MKFLLGKTVVGHEPHVKALGILQQLPVRLPGQGMDIWKRKRFVRAHRHEMPIWTKLQELIYQRLVDLLVCRPQISEPRGRNGVECRRRFKRRTISGLKMAQVENLRNQLNFFTEA